MDKIKCQECGKKFQPKRFWAKFCSDKCRNDYHNRRECPRCGYKRGDKI